jgi:hypothetical protein
VVVESDGAAARDYLSALLDYVHLNPARAGLVAPVIFIGFMSWK